MNISYSVAHPWYYHNVWTVDNSINDTLQGLGVAIPAGHYLVIFRSNMYQFNIGTSYGNLSFNTAGISANHGNEYNCMNCTMINEFPTAGASSALYGIYMVDMVLDTDCASPSVYLHNYYPNNPNCSTYEIWICCIQ